MVTLGPFTVSRTKPAPAPIARGEVGHLSTAMFQQFIDQEYLSELRWPNSLRIFDRMRRSDGQVQAVLMALELPIRSTKWHVEPASQEPRDQEIAEFVEENLFDGLTLTFDDTLRLALGMYPFGHSIMEKVFHVGSDGYLRWKKFAERPQTTVSQFVADNAGDLLAVEQMTPTALTRIPSEKLLWFTHRQEQGDPRGTSVLRSAYKHWYIKDFVYKLVNIGIEQEYVGIPWASVPANMPDDVRTTLTLFLEALTKGEKAWGYLPDTIDLKRYQSQRDQTSVMPYIEHHDIMIARSVLAQFITLGQGDVGSFALSEDHSNLFLMTLDATANYVASVFNRFAIPELVAANWSTDQYPKLTHDPVGARDITSLTTALAGLLGTVITPDGPLEEYMRDYLGLPERDEREPDGVAIPPGTNPEAPQDSLEATTAPEAVPQVIETPIVASLAEGRIWRRDLTPYEQRINLAEIDQTIGSAEEQLAREGRDAFADALAPIWPRILELLEAGDIAGIADLTAGTTGLATWLAGFYRTLMQDAAEQAADELDTDAPEIDEEADERNNASSQVLARAVMDTVLNRVKQQAMNAIESGADPVFTQTTLQAAVEEQAERALKQQALVRVTNVVNQGREIARQETGVQLAQYSAILDDRVCELCEYLDGMVIEISDPDYERFSPPQHSGCRCIWAFVLPDETPQPEVTWQTPPDDLVAEHGWLSPR